ncbi:MAG: helix-turn-helix transcriptional regulator [Bacteroidota bacterium]
MNIGTAIKTIRKEKGLGQKELADKCGLSVNALSQIETNSSFPHKNTIENIAIALGVPISYLLFFSISEDDVPENKREIFNTLNTVLKDILIQSIAK